MRALVAAVLCIVLAAAAAPQAVVERETRRAVPGAPAPAAKVADLAWLAGAWKGEGIDGAPAYEFWSPPIGDQIVGHFVQTNAEGVRFSEIVSIAEKNGSLELRLKHFNADLSGWEEKDEIVRFPLVAVAPDAWYFDGLTIRRDGPDGLIGAVVAGPSGSQRELVFRYRRIR